MKFWIVLLIIAIIVLIWLLFWNNSNNGNNTNYPPLPIVNVDLNKYQGLWYEIARLPNMFQEGCINSTATYTVNPNKTMGIQNRCQLVDPSSNPMGSTPNQTGIPTIAIDGTAYPNYNEAVFGSNIFPGSFTTVMANQPSHMKVEGNYNVLLLDPSYRYALVGTNDRKFLWILSRTRTMNPLSYNEYIKYAAQLGYDTNAIIKN